MSLNVPDVGSQIVDKGGKPSGPLNAFFNLLRRALLLEGTATIGDVVIYQGGNNAGTGGASADYVKKTGTLTDHAVILGSGTNVVHALASLGTAGQVLTSGGAGTDPSWGGGSGGTGISLIASSTAQVSVSNTITESSLYAPNVPALSATGLVRLTVRGLATNNTGSNRTYQIKVKLGSTVMWDGTCGAVGTNANDQPWSIVLEMGNVAATNSQKMLGRITIGAFTNGPTTGKGGDEVAIASQSSQYLATIYGTAAEDLTSTKTLDVRVILSTNSTNLTLTKEIGILELLAP